MCRFKLEQMLVEDQSIVNDLQTIFYWQTAYVKVPLSVVQCEIVVEEYGRHFDDSLNHFGLCWKMEVEKNQLVNHWNI